MATLYRWKDSRGNASEPMTLEAATERDKVEKNMRNPLGLYRPNETRSWIFPVEVTQKEFELYTR